jgi:hypothetical protein
MKRLAFLPFALAFTGAGVILGVLLLVIGLVYVADHPAVTPDPARLSTIAPPANLDALLEAKAAAANPIAIVIRPDGNGGWVANVRAPYALVTITPTPDQTDTPATVPPTNTPRTPTVTSTPTSTKVPTKTATATSTDDEATPTQEHEIPTDEPTAELPADKTCELKVIESGGIRVRREPTRSSVQIGYAIYPEQPTIDEFKIVQYREPSPSTRVYDELWAHIDIVREGARVTGWMVAITKLGQGDQDAWVAGVTGHSEMCLDVQGWPEGLEPPEAIVALPFINEQPAGLHVLGGFQKTWDILAEIEHFNVLKVTDDAAFLMSEARKINSDVITLHRNLHLIGLGLRDCPDGWGVGDPISSARSWWSVQVATWKARNLWGQGSPVNYYEYRNECRFSGSWEIAFDKEIIRLANIDGVCLAIQSYAYGQPEPEEYATLAPVLDAILAQECAPGKRHIIASHTYGNIQSGEWIFGRWLKFRAAVGSKYDGIQWVFSEFGLTNTDGANNGRGTPECPRAALETQQAVIEYKKHPEVLGFSIFSFGAGTEWSDYTPCLPQIAAALQ